MLTRGLKFVPCPKTTCKTPILRAGIEFSRRLKLSYFFNPVQNQPRLFSKLPFTTKSGWTPEDKYIDNEVLEKIDEMNGEIEQLKPAKNKLNMSKSEYKALSELKNNRNIVIKKADKGSAVVLMDKADYIKEGNRQLSNRKHYSKIDNFIFPSTALKINKVLNTLCNEHGVITPDQLDYLKASPEARPRRIYFTPKIHKPRDKWIDNIPPGRPIVSDIDSESYHVSEYIDSFLKPLACLHGAYLKDTTDFLTKLRQTNATQNCLLVTLDVESLYTNIDTASGLRAVRKAFNDNPCPLRKDNEILKLLELCLKGGDFEFGDDKYLQVSGTAMGKKFAPNYANIFMAEWEKNAIGRSPLKPEFYKRFLDDIFLIWQHGLDALLEFLEILNNHHPSIKLTATIQEVEIDFLDVTVYKGPNFEENGKLDTKMFFKETDTHSLLLKSSFHPKHTFRGILKSQILRFHRICTHQNDFDEACSIVFKVLRERGYTKRFLRSVKSETLRGLSGGYVPPPMPPDAEDCEVESDLPGSRPCGENCVMCPYVGITNSVYSTNTKQKIPILEHLNCKSSNVIYLIHCNCCKIQYIGETGRAMVSRFRLHSHHIRHDNPTSATSSHFKHDCDMEHFFIMPIVQCPKLETPESTTKNRRNIEASIIKLFQSYIPYGLNRAVKGVEDVPVMPFVAPYSNLAISAADIVRDAYNEMQSRFPDRFPGKLVTAYSRNKNLQSFLTSSKLT